MKLLAGLVLAASMTSSTAAEDSQFVVEQRMGPGGERIAVLGTPKPGEAAELQTVADPLTPSAQAPSPAAKGAPPIASGSVLALIGTCTLGSGDDLQNAGTIEFAVPPVNAAGSNDFAIAVGQTSTLASLDFAAPTFAFTFASAGSFVATSQSIRRRTPDFANVALNGTWSLSGFSDTPGSLLLGATWQGGECAFSAIGGVDL